MPQILLISCTNTSIKSVLVFYFAETKLSVYKMIIKQFLRLRFLHDYNKVLNMVNDPVLYLAHSLIFLHFYI